MVTVIDAPPMKVVGLRFYAQTGDGKRPLGEIWHDPLPKELARRIRLPGKSAKTEAETDAIKKAASRISLIVCTQPHLAGFGKKNPEIMECAVAGDTTDAQFKTAKDFLGREIRARDVLVAGDFVDVFAVSKGKGFQGPVKRFGVAIQKNPNKVKKAARKVATIGQFRPGRTFWTVPMPGQMGCHQHCELNKQVMKLGESGFVRPGGWKHYGTVPGDYILIAGSVPGPAKRLIRFRFAVRKKEPAEKPNIVTVVGEAK